MISGRWGYLVAALAVLLATAIVLVLERWFPISNLVLVYVLVVVATGLRQGYAPAILASFLSFLSFNFFLTEPRYTLEVERQEELATLIFLLLIALISGSAASRIRRQFLSLHQANRYSETMRDLSLTLAETDRVDVLWQQMVARLTDLLAREVCIVLPVDQGDCRIFPDSADIDKSELLATLDRLRQTDDYFSMRDWDPLPLWREDRWVACVLIRSTPEASGLRQADRKLVLDMLGQAVDRWQRIELDADLESARVKAEVEQLRSALLSSVSHDLKSPLSAMMGAAESLHLLEQQLSPQDRQELVETILQESRRLDSYIQNLLDMTRLGHGSLSIERNWVSVADLLGSALTRLKRYHPEVKTEVHIEDAPSAISVHAALVEQALFNILENAARFNPPGEKIRIEVSRDGEKCLIAIEDRGPGIPEPLREKIFDMFYVVAEGDKKRQGTGMGLAICRGMIGAHGGRVLALAGADNMGTRIQVEIPVSGTIQGNMTEGGE